MPRSVLAAGLGFLTGAVLAGCLVVRRLAVVTVSGRSMEPTLQDGDRLLAVRLRSGHRAVGQLRSGDLVVLEEPQPGSPDARDRRWLVKRVAAVPGETVPIAAAGAIEAGQAVPAGHLVVLGDNPDVSYDSRRAGFIPADRLFARIARPLRTR